MKKKRFGIAAIVAVGMIAGYNVYTSQKSITLSDLAFDNVEALAWGGESSTFYRLFPCPSRPGNECMFSQDNSRPECFSLSYCY